MNIQSLRLRACAFVAGLAMLAISGFASADPPSRVVRLGYTAGAVSFSPAGEDDWVQATINRPLTIGDRLWVDSGARAELQIGGAILRLNAGTSVMVLNLDDNIAQLQLTQGTMNVRVRRFDPGQVLEVDTPNLAFTRAAGRRLPDCRGHRRQCDGSHRAQGPRRGLWRKRILRRRLAAAVSLHGHGPARVPAVRAAWQRRFRSLGARSRPPLRHLGVGPLCIAGRRRLSGPRCERHVERRRDLRQRLVPDARRGRLGALSRRPLGMGRPLGLDVGG